MRGYTYTSGQVNPYVNLAIEEHLLGTGAPVLYFWQNGPSVIVGRNQNAYTECNLDYVRANNVRVARRMTGGGAVYHDLGNLNYSIVLPKALHDIPRSTGVIVRALDRLGLPVTASGRNDILLDGLKISGNAYYSNDTVGLHHGTILHTLDTDAITQALAVSDRKKARHGIVSVRSRVTDIASHCPALSMDEIKTAIGQAFCEEYGLGALEPLAIDDAAIAPLVSRYASDEWIFGRINEFDVSREASFAWGSVKVSVQFAGDTPTACEITSDSLDPDTIDEARRVLNSQGSVYATHNPMVDAILNVYKDIVFGRTDYDS